jgi:membrane fusion protein, multidrug efflux system
MRTPLSLREMPPLLLVLLGACSPAEAHRAAEEAPAVPVRIAAIEHSLVSQPVLGTGVLGDKEEVALSFKIGGVIGRISVDEGDRIRAGQTLATLESVEIAAQVAKAQSALDKAERDRARIESLYRDSVATLEQLQNTTTGVEVAYADLEAAQFNRRFAAITAPADGVVLRRQAETGELVEPGSLVLIVGTERGGSVLRVGVADRDAVRLSPGDPAAVRFDAYPEAVFAGRVTELPAAADRRSGTWEVEVLVDGAGRALPSGLIGRVEITPAGGRELPLVPVEAIVEADGDQGVLYSVANDGTARRHEVRIGGIHDSRVAIVAGTEGLTSVVTDGSAYLSDGALVEVVR